MICLISGGNAERDEAAETGAAGGIHMEIDDGDANAHNETDTL